MTVKRMSLMTLCVIAFIVFTSQMISVLADPIRPVNITQHDKVRYHTLLQHEERHSLQRTYDISVAQVLTFC